MFLNDKGAAAAAWPHLNGEPEAKHAGEADEQNDCGHNEHAAALDNSSVVAAVWLRSPPAPSIGGSVVTRSGLIFVAATTDQYLRAFDLANGRELRRGRLPAGGQATPTTYVAPDGHQYVVVMAGDHGALETRYGDYTIAFRLP